MPIIRLYENIIMNNSTALRIAVEILFEKNEQKD
jgi:hypothetical protein